jgi:acyl carrier protein
MNSMLSFAQFKQMIGSHFGVEETRLTEATSFLDDLGVDSLSLVNFIVRLEKKYGIKIEMDRAWSLGNIGEVYEMLVERIALSPQEAVGT